MTARHRPAKKARAAAAAVTPGTPTWSVQRINAPLLWQLGITGDGVLAAVIDTGVNYHHPDLKSQMWDGGATYPHHGYDFESNDTNPIDEAGHGTSCAGIVAGNGAKGQGTGVAPKATVMALRVGGRESNYWKAFEFAIDRGVQGDQHVDVVEVSVQPELHRMATRLRGAGGGGDSARQQHRQSGR